MAFTLRLPAVLGLLVAAYGLVVRRRLLRWGATDEELSAAYPGADIVQGGKRGATTAVTVDAPPSRVWPWLVQMGCDRAGWYSWDRLDNGGVASSAQIHPEWQDMSVGDHLASSPGGSGWFEVVKVEPERFLALRASLDLRGAPFEASGSRPRFFSDSLWAFRLEELAGEQTRLVVSGYACSNPRPLTAIGDFVFWEPAHWIMQTRQFANLKRRAERSSSTAVNGPAELARVGAATV